MNTYDSFLLELSIAELSDADFDIYCEELSDDVRDFMIKEGFFLKKDKGGGGFKRKNVLSKLKTRKSDGSGGTVSNSASARHKTAKRSKRAWKSGGRKSSAKKNLVARKTRKSKRKSGGAKR